MRACWWLRLAAVSEGIQATLHTVCLSVFLFALFYRLIVQGSVNYQGGKAKQRRDSAVSAVKKFKTNVRIGLLASVPILDLFGTAGSRAALARANLSEG
jgi:hypothetical protein